MDYSQRFSDQRRELVDYFREGYTTQMTGPHAIDVDDDWEMNGVRSAAAEHIRRLVDEKDYFTLTPEERVELESHSLLADGVADETERSIINGTLDDVMRAIRTYCAKPAEEEEPAEVKGTTVLGYLRRLFAKT
jgi:hypothetical protein